MPVDHVSSRSSSPVNPPPTPWRDVEAHAQGQTAMLCTVACIDEVERHRRSLPGALRSLPRKPELRRKSDPSVRGGPIFVAPDSRPATRPMQDVAAPAHVVLPLGTEAPVAWSAAYANTVLDCFDAMRRHAQGLDFAADVEQHAAGLRAYAEAGTPPDDPALRDLVARAREAFGREPAHDLDRFAMLSAFMASPSWSEWARAWGRDLGLLNLRELPIALVGKFVQSASAAGFQRLFLASPTAGGITTLLCSVFAIARQACAIYSQRGEARARSQIARALQIAGLCALLVTAGAWGGWALLTRLGAAQLSYTIGTTVSTLARHVMSMKWPITATRSGRERWARSAACSPWRPG